MLRIRTLAALCSREVSHSKSLGRWRGGARGGANIVVRTLLTDDHSVGSAAAAAPPPPGVEAPFERAHVSNGEQEEGGWENEESVTVGGIEHNRQGFVGARGKPWDVSMSGRTLCSRPSHHMRGVILVAASCLAPSNAASPRQEMQQWPQRQYRCCSPAVDECTAMHLSHPQCLGCGATWSCHSYSSLTVREHRL